MDLLLVASLLVAARRAGQMRATLALSAGIWWRKTSGSIARNIPRNVNHHFEAIKRARAMQPESSSVTASLGDDRNANRARANDTHTHHHPPAQTVESRLSKIPPFAQDS